MSRESTLFVPLGVRVWTHCRTSAVLVDDLRQGGRNLGGTTMAKDHPPLDDVDERLLAELTSDARQSVTALAQKVHISRAHAYARVNRLQETGVITRFSTVVDHTKAGLSSSAYVSLKLRHHGWRDVRAALAKIPEIHHISLVGGNFDVLLLVRARDNEGLRRVVFDHIQGMPGVLDTQTFVIFEDVDTRGPQAS